MLSPYKTNGGLAYDVRMLPKRKFIRIREYDYSTPAFYFVTVCAFRMKSMFAEVVSEKVELSKFGKIVHKCWHAIPSHFPDTKLDAFVIMPNHIHGIIRITSIHSASLSTIVQNFKSITARRVNQLRHAPGEPL